MILATVSGLSAWILVGAAFALCGWALWTARRDYLRICAEDAQRVCQREPETAADLDDWLAGEEPLLDFHVARRPVASTKSPRVVRATEGMSHTEEAA